MKKHDFWKFEKVLACLFLQINSSYICLYIYIYIYFIFLPAFTIKMTFFEWQLFYSIDSRSLMA